MTARKVESIIKTDGWYRVDGSDSSHRQYEHPVKKGKVTISFHRLHVNPES